MRRSPIDVLALRYRRTGTGAAVLVYGFLLLPSLLVIPISFGSADQIQFPPSSLSTRLYVELFGSTSWMHALRQSAIVAVLTTLLSLFVSVPAAYGMVRLNFPGKQAIVALLMSPVAIPVIVTALGLYLYFSLFGLTGSTFGLVLAHTVYVSPFVIITVAAGVRKLDPTLEFAATMMGASRLTLLRHVLLPQLAASIFAGGMFALLLSFDEVVIAWFLTGPNTATLPVKMYSSIQWEISPVIAAVSTLLTALSFIVCCVAAAFQRTEAIEARR
jgi:putative spermidine/putrescine transport system permease protein